MATEKDGAPETKTILDLGPRPEAGAFAYENLTEQQQSAFDRALRFVHGIATQPWKPRETHASGPEAELDLFLPVIEPLRGNHVLLIDGGRGSGKTSVLLSLLQAWSDAVRGKTISRPVDARESPEGRAMLEPYGSIVPLALIDLQPLPTSTSLMLHVAGPLQRVVEAMERRAVSTKPTRWEPNASAELDSRQSWRRFAQAVALGWDANVRERARSVDPETYATELEQAELKRLDVRECFSRFVDDVAREYRDWRHLPTPPLFVLAFDDADMSPELSVELLRLFSSLRHPRLVFLATGDSQLFFTSLRRYYLGALRRVVGAHAAISDQDLKQLGDEQEPAQLAHQAYDKVIPNGQRLVLEDIAREERISFVEVRHGKEVSGRSIETLLSDVQIIPVFADELERASDSHIFLVQFQHDPQLYEALPGNIRRLIELQRKLPAVINERSPYPLAARILECMWKDALSASDLLPGQKKNLASCVRQDDLLKIFIFDSSSVLFSSISRYPTQPFVTASGRARHSSLYPLRWDSYYRNQPVDTQLSSQVTACLMLAANFAAVSGIFQNGTPVPADCFGESYFDLSGGHVLIFHWPTPTWESFSDVALVARPLKDYKGTDTHHGFDSYIAVLLWIVARVGAKFDSTLPSTGGEEFTWGNIAKMVHSFVNGPYHSQSRRQKLLARWARSLAGLFACPEYGLSASSAKQWLEALATVFGAEWTQVREELIVERKRRMNDAIGAIKELKINANVVFAELSLACPDHPGNDLVNMPDV